MVLWKERLTLETEVEGSIPGHGEVVQERSRIRNYAIKDLSKGKKS